MTVVWIVAGVIAIAAFIFILWHFRQQSDFERSDHVVPEDYD